MKSLRPSALFAVLATGLIFTPGLEAQELREKPGLEIEHGWKNKLQPRMEAMRSGGAHAALSSATGTAVTGTLPLPVILVHYPESPMQLAPNEIKERIFGDPEGLVSANAFYKEMSGGKFSLSGDVAPPILLPNASSYYVGNRGTQGIAERLSEYLLDVVGRANDRFDWRQYDNDGPDGQPNSGDDDGRVDAVVIVFASEDGACVQNRNNYQMWSHRWNLNKATGRTFQTSRESAKGGPIVLDDYIMVAGFDCDRTRLAPMGTLTHEIGHVIGLPDLYAVDNSTSQGVGFWDLMATGNWNSPEYPAALGAWSRYVLGWVEAEVISDKIAHRVTPVHTTKKVTRVNATEGNEFLLMEYRKRTATTDARLLQDGMLIWHINPDRLAETLKGNKVNSDAENMGVKLIQADGQSHLEKGTNRADAGDVWPGSTEATTFSPSTTPAAVKLADGTELGFRLDDIRVSGDNVVLDITRGVERITTVNVTASEAGAKAFVNDSLVSLPHSMRLAVGESFKVAVDTTTYEKTRIRFLSWADGANQFERTITITGRDEVALRANVAREYRLRATSNDTEKGTISVRVGQSLLSQGDSWVVKGDTVRLEATPAADSLVLLFWDGTVTTQDRKATAALSSSVVAPMTEAIDVQAIFIARPNGSEPIAASLVQAGTTAPASVLRYLDVFGNINDRFDSGDVVLGLKSGRLLLEDGQLKLADPTAVSTTQRN